MSTEIKQPVQLIDIADLKSLGPLELQVMQVVWRREEAGHEATVVSDYVNEVNASIKTVAYTTIMTIFKHLHEKKWLKLLGKQGCAFSYHSARSRQEVGQEILRWTVREFFDGDPAKFVLADEESEDGRKLAVVAED